MRYVELGANHREKLGNKGTRNSDLRHDEIKA